MAKIITLSQNQVAIVDDADYERLSQWKWSARWDGHNWYATARMGRKQVSMHRFIMGVTDPRIQVDHWDGNGLHNRQKNLRVCTHKDNLRNRKLFKNNTTGYKGVSLFRQSRITTKFQAKIRVDGILKHLGTFKTDVEAAKAYDKAAIKHYGEFARLNFPEEA